MTWVAVAVYIMIGQGVWMASRDEGVPWYIALGCAMTWPVAIGGLLMRAVLTPPAARSERA